MTALELANILSDRLEARSGREDTYTVPPANCLPFVAIGGDEGRAAKSRKTDCGGERKGSSKQLNCWECRKHYKTYVVTSFQCP